MTEFFLQVAAVHGVTFCPPTCCPASAYALVLSSVMCVPMAGKANSCSRAMRSKALGSGRISA
eukprot:3924803-Amphidinium_carterae.1